MSALHSKQTQKTSLCVYSVCLRISTMKESMKHHTPCQMGSQGQRTSLSLYSVCLHISTMKESRKHHTSLWKRLTAEICILKVKTVPQTDQQIQARLKLVETWKAYSLTSDTYTSRQTERLTELKHCVPDLMGQGLRIGGMCVKLYWKVMSISGSMLNLMVIHLTGM